MGLRAYGFKTHVYAHIYIYVYTNMLKYTGMVVSENGGRGGAILFAFTSASERLQSARVHMFSFSRTGSGQVRWPYTTGYGLGQGASDVCGVRLPKTDPRWGLSHIM